MINYNPKVWLSLILHPYSGQVMRTLAPLLLFMAAFSVLFCYLVLDVFHLNEHGIYSTSVVHSLLGIVLGLFLVFRTNSAYDRWWEGRKQWGLMVNNTRNLAHKLNAFLDRNDMPERMWFAQMISNFVLSTKEHLRNNATVEKLDIPDSEFFECVQNVYHIPNRLSSMMYERITEWYKKNKISGEQLFMVDKELKQFSDILGACERIKNTPIPYSYSMYIKKFVFIYLITLPFGFVTTIGYMTVFVVLLLSYILLSIELIAEEIEDPFGHDINDLPTDAISSKIRENVYEILKVELPGVVMQKDADELVERSPV